MVFFVCVYVPLSLVLWTLITSCWPPGVKACGVAGVRAAAAELEPSKPAEENRVNTLEPTSIIIWLLRKEVELR